jgi:SAM-dependent methyltransferase
VLELNCGTGADAEWLGERGVHVRATDASQRMVDVACARGVDATQLAAEEVGSLADVVEQFDGALSNFGGLNCVDDLNVVASGLARCVRRGGTALLCVMGPTVPWEWIWYLGHGKPRAAFRRFRRSTVWRGMTIRYPSVSALRSTFDPWWTARRVWALGALVPPTYAESWAVRHPRALARLDRLERRMETWPLVARLADHYVIELERR